MLHKKPAAGALYDPMIIPRVKQVRCFLGFIVFAYHGTLGEPKWSLFCVEVRFGYMFSGFPQGMSGSTDCASLSRLMLSLPGY